MKTISNLSVMSVVMAAASGTSLAVGIIGGPAFDDETGTGYRAPAISSNAGTLNGNGVGVGRFTKFNNGTQVGFRAIRWSANGVVELGSLRPDGSPNGDSRADLINAAGTTAGTATKYDANGNSLGTYAVRWDAGSTVATQLATLGGGSGANVLGINAGGTIVGRDSSRPGGGRPVRWDAGGTAATELAVLASSSSGVNSAGAYAINTSGTAVGVSGIYNGTTFLGNRAVRWAAGGTAVTELGTLPGSSAFYFANAGDINDAGTTVGGTTYYENGQERGNSAVRWDAGSTTAIKLNPLSTATDGTIDSQAIAINNSGTIVGTSIRYAGNIGLGTRPVRWAAGGTAVTELGNLGLDNDGGTSVDVFDLNNAGFAVGSIEKYSGGSFGGNRAVSWGADGAAFDLNRMLALNDAAKWTLTEARGISDTNWITGIGTYDADGAGSESAPYSRAFLIKLALPGDADNDDKVDFNDFLVLQNAYGHTQTASAFSPADFNYDGVTDFNDFLILQNQFGKSLSGATAAVTPDQVAALQAFASAVPEPASLAMAGGLALLLRRIRPHS